MTTPNPREQSAIWLLTRAGYAVSQRRAATQSGTGTRVVSARLAAADYDALSKLAAACGMKLGAYAAELLRAHLEEMGAKPEE